jgi:diaminopropionate ammonia-lyase
MLGPMPFRVFANPRYGEVPASILDDAGFRLAKAEITSWPGYAMTPLREVPDITRQVGLGTIRLKDEASRFGRGSFKALGGAYAVASVVAAHRNKIITVTCATDGNHGRAVAWGAQRCHCHCVIFVHEAVSRGRAEAIAHYGAEVRRVPGTYDDAVREAARQAQANDWFLVSDTSWPGYTDLPRQIMQGYRLMVDEVSRQWSGASPTHVFVQGGVGGVAAAVAVQMRAWLQPAPALIVVEPDRAACLLASAELGEPTTAPGNLDTLMAGLACGEPSIVAWQILDRAAAAFMAIPDEAAVACMRLLARHGIVAGESAVAGLAGCLLAATDPAARAVLGLEATSRVLAFSTEGATDPELYERLTGSTPADVGASSHLEG